MNRYNDIAQAKTDTGTRYIRNSIYPFIPETENDIYLITTAGDRFDILAQQYYRDSTLWWIIASANNSMNGSLIPKPGVQIRIPADKNSAIKLYNQVNSTR